MNVKVVATKQGWDGFANIMRGPGDEFEVPESIFTAKIDPETGESVPPSWFVRADEPKGTKGKQTNPATE